MIRYIGQYSVIQRTSDGFFDANSLLKEWNSKSDNPKREMKKFLSSPKTEEFITALRLRLAQSQKCDMVNINVLDEARASRYETGCHSQDKDIRLDIINQKPSAHAEVP